MVHYFSLCLLRGRTQRVASLHGRRKFRRQKFRRQKFRRQKFRGQKIRRND